MKRLAIPATAVVLLAGCHGGDDYAVLPLPDGRAKVTIYHEKQAGSLRAVSMRACGGEGAEVIDAVQVSSPPFTNAQGYIVECR